MALRIMLTTLMYSYTGTCNIVYLIIGNQSDVLYDKLYASALYAIGYTRTYIYSNANDMILWKNVEDHSKIAIGKGLDVRMERFEGSAHVSHLRLDAGRCGKSSSLCGILLMER
jgi:hypothetical protein